MTSRGWSCKSSGRKLEEIVVLGDLCLAVVVFSDDDACDCSKVTAKATAETRDTHSLSQRQE